MSAAKPKLPRENVYVCEYGCHNVTVDVDKGVTPFMMRCRTTARPGRPLVAKLTGKDGVCMGMARSAMYPREPRPAHIAGPTHEWYAPSEEERRHLEPAMRDYVEHGGLMIRPRTDRGGLP